MVPIDYVYVRFSMRTLITFSVLFCFSSLIPRTL